MPQGRARVVLFWIAIAALVPVAIAVFARATGFEGGPLAILVSVMPWVSLASILPLALAALSRSFALIVAAGILSAVCFGWQVPIFTGGGGGEPRLVVASVNMQLARATPTPSWPSSSRRA